MGLMDRVKAQAAQIAQQAQEAAQEGRSRLDQVQSFYVAWGDALLRQLGAAVFAERTGRGTADSQARIDQLINDISAYERENGLDLTSPAQPSSPQLGFPAGAPGPFGGPQPGSAPGGGAGPFGGPQPGSAPGGAGPFPGPVRPAVLLLILLGPPYPDPSGSPPPEHRRECFGESRHDDHLLPPPGDDQPG